MFLPYVDLSEPSNPRRLADCGGVSSFGGAGQIRIRPSLLTGTYHALKGGPDYREGRFLFVAGTLGHEMIHQWQGEVVGNLEEHYHGHGPIFRDKANEIGARLGLPRVRANRRDGKDRDLPICSQWPHNVQPKSHYLGAYVPTSRDAKKPKKVSIPLDLEAALPILRKHFDVDELCRRLPDGDA